MFDIFRTFCQKIFFIAFLSFKTKENCLCAIYYNNIIKYVNKYKKLKKKTVFKHLVEILTYKIFCVLMIITKTEFDNFLYLFI
jgi:hypothetical protein